MNKFEQWEKDAEFVANYYTDKIAEKGYSCETLAGRDEKYTNIFYNKLLNGIKLDNKISVLDIGSGLGLIIPYFKGINIEFNDYLGVDLIPQFVDYSKEKYPKQDFMVGNFVSKDFKLPKKYGYVIALGVLVSRVSDYEAYLKEFISKMIECSSKYVLFNLVTEVDEDSSNYDNKDKNGGITFIEKTKIETILDDIKGIKYKIVEERIFEDATDAFIQIEVK